MRSDHDLAPSSGMAADGPAKASAMGKRVLARRIEESSLNAWPALQQILLDGWILRFSQGYTRRANSVNPLFDSRLDAGDKIETCERLYAERGLPPVFRLTPFATPPHLDQALADRGYARAAPTQVLHLGLGHRPVEPVRPVVLHHEPLDRWLDMYYAFSGASPDTRSLHRRILEAIPSRCAPVLAVDAGQPVACGLGVLETGTFGLFDLATDPASRGHGYGTALVAGLLAWAQANGGQHAYLQVMERNEPARRLYAKFGFRESYSYWYRVPTG